MRNTQLFSRRISAAVDFKPDMDPKSPFAQLRRLSARMAAENAGPDDLTLTDCPDALNYLRELTYRKIFTGTSHEEFVKLDQESPETIDWLIAVHETENAAFTARKGQR